MAPVRHGGGPSQLLSELPMSPGSASASHASHASHAHDPPMYIRKAVSECFFFFFPERRSEFRLSGFASENPPVVYSWVDSVVHRSRNPMSRYMFLGAKALARTWHSSLISIFCAKHGISTSTRNLPGHQLKHCIRALPNPSCRVDLVLVGCRTQTSDRTASG